MANSCVLCVGTGNTKFIEFSSLQLQRVHKKKQLYDLIFLSKEELNRFNIYREYTIKKIKLYFRNIEPSRDIEPKKWIIWAKNYGHDYLLKNVKAYHISDIEPSNYEKMYIRGHGEPNGKGILSGEKYCTTSELAKILSTNNLLSIPKINLMSCWGADRKRIGSFCCDDVNKSLGFPKSSSLLDKLRFKLRRTKSLHYRFCKALKRNGYKGLVSAYHGQGRNLGVDFNVQSLSYENTKDDKYKIRRSLVKRTCQVSSEGIKLLKLDKFLQGDVTKSVRKLNKSDKVTKSMVLRSMIFANSN